MSLSKAYHWLLWIVGFQEGETVSGMLVRQKQRLGWVWWVLPITTIIVFLGFTVWLIAHIVKTEKKSAGYDK